MLTAPECRIYKKDLHYIYRSGSSSIASLQISARQEGMEIPRRRFVSSHHKGVWVLGMR